MKVRKIFSFFLQTWVTFNKHVVHYSIEFLRVKITTLDPDYLSSDCVHYEEYYYTFYSLACAVSRNRSGAGLANLVATVPCILLYRLKYSSN
jgi:hypothetical protein